MFKIPNSEDQVIDALDEEGWHSGEKSSALVW